MYGVTVSCARKDENIAGLIVAELEKCGVLCWYAPRDLVEDESSESQILRAIRHSFAYVLILSSHNNDSDYVIRELSEATTVTNIATFLFRIEDVSLPKSANEYRAKIGVIDAPYPRNKGIAMLSDILSKVVAESESDSDRRSSSDSVDTLREKAVYYETKAVNALSRGGRAIAEFCLKKAIRLNEAIYERTAEPYALRTLGVTYFRLGEVSIKQYDYPQADKYFAKYLELTKSAAEKLGTRTARGYVGDALRDLGDSAKIIGDLDKANTYYVMQTEWFKSMSSEEKDVISSQGMASSYVRRGNIFKDKRAFDEAERLYSESLRAIEKSGDESALAPQLVDSCLALGDLCVAKGDRKTAEKHYKRGVQLAKDIFTEKVSTFSKRNLANSYMKLAACTPKYEDALSYYNLAEQQLEPIFRKTRTLLSREELLACYDAIIELAKQNGEMTTMQVYEVRRDVIDDDNER